MEQLKHLFLSLASVVMIGLPLVTWFALSLEEHTDWDFEMDIMIPFALFLISWETWAGFIGIMFAIALYNNIRDMN